MVGVRVVFVMNKEEAVEVIAGLCLLLQAIWDIRTKELPLWISLVLGSCGFLYSVCNKRSGLEILIALLPGLFCLLLGYVTRQAIGYGDGILICSLGLIYTWQDVVQICSIAIVFAGLMGIVLLVVFRKNGKYEIPFVPFLFLGWCVLLGMRL